MTAVYPDLARPTYDPALIAAWTAETQRAVAWNRGRAERELAREATARARDLRDGVGRR